MKYQKQWQNPMILISRAFCVNTEKFSHFPVHVGNPVTQLLLLQQEPFLIESLPKAGVFPLIGLTHRRQTSAFKCHSNLNKF